MAPRDELDGHPGLLPDVEQGVDELVRGPGIASPGPSPAPRPGHRTAAGPAAAATGSPTPPCPSTSTASPTARRGSGRCASAREGPGSSTE